MTATPAGTPLAATRGPSADAWRARVLSAATIVMEALPLAVLVALLGKIPGNHAETPSAWAVIGLVAIAFLATRRLAETDLSPTKRRLLGALITIAAIQIVARLDLSESLRLWDFGWLPDLADPDSEAFRKYGRVDHTIDGFLLIAVWFRGVFLARADPESRGLIGPAIFAAFAFGAGFIGGDNVGVISTVRIAALAYVMLGLSVVAFRAAGRAQAGDGGSFRATSVSFGATLALVWAAVAIFMLVVLLLIAAIAGAGIAEPVTDTLGDGLRAIITGVAYIFWPLVWLFDQIVPDNPGPLDTELAPVTLEGIGDGPDVEVVEEVDPDSTVGAIFVRVFGGIAVVILFAILVIVLFRRFSSRPTATDEERDSVWSEAHLLDDFLGSMRRLRDRFGRPGGGGPSDTPLALLYFEVLADAERAGLNRPVSRTPLQFAPALRSHYRSEVPAQISEQFSRLRYADQSPPDDEVARLREAWRRLRASAT